MLAHELWHVQRRDNLAAAVHMLVEAVFWFHPLLWWLGARLVEERERACDEEVLEMGKERQVYAESILKICEFCVESPELISRRGWFVSWRRVLRGNWISAESYCSAPRPWRLSSSRLLLAW